MSNREQFHHPDTFSQGLLWWSSFAAGLRLRLSGELSAGFIGALFALDGKSAGQLPLFLTSHIPV